jgi:diaminohydroxyphosphoribosylaminopyrimidine deaminase/5-amino-6-(5-phosphoribosylamino)uracil reductase
MTDQHWMAEAIAAAGTALGSTWPNPAVGAVLVKNDQLIARGATQAAGGNHAEIECIRQAGEAARGASLYATMEPCCHYGKTPPCTDAIIRAGITRVVYALSDPNPLVAGKGEAALLAAGIETERGVMADEALPGLREFFHFMRTGRPFITVKYAITLDGRLSLDSGDAHWISGEESRAHAQLLRKRTHAILSGGQTIRHDDPRLDCRIAGEEFQPIRIIVTEQGFSPDARLFDHGGSVLLVTSDAACRSIPPALLQKTETIALPELTMGAIMQALAARGIVSIVTEAGPRLLTQLIAARFCDQVITYIAPVLAGGNALRSIGDIGTERMLSAPRLRGEWKSYGGDICFQGEPVW